MNIQWTNKAAKQLDKIADRSVRKEIMNETAKLADFPNVTQVKKLTNHKHEYRLRVGNYRVLFDVKNSVQIISIEEVKKRDDRTY